jgi:hypothetical protein
MDEDEVSIELQGDVSERASKGVVGLGLATVSSRQRTSTIVKTAVDAAQPSPPPPYGPVLLSQIDGRLTSVSTPPTQDIDDDPLECVPMKSVQGDAIEDEDEEEDMRRQRAMEAAKSLGLAMRFSPSKMSSDGSGDELMDAEEIRKQLRQMKRRLKIRDHGMSPQVKGITLANEDRIGHGRSSCQLCVATA